MPDGDLLFADLVELRPVAGGCQAPIGRRHASRPSLTLALLAELRALVVAIGEDERTRSRHVARLVARQTRPLTDIVEAVDQIRKRLVAVERALGVCEPPAAPRPTRRRPDA